MSKRNLILTVLMVALAFTLTACQQKKINDNYKGYETSNSQAIGSVITKPYTMDGKRYTPMTAQEAMNYRERGQAVWYGDEIWSEGGNYRTASGEPFDENLMTAGHKYLPLPTYVKVTNTNNNRSIIVRVNDRGPFHPDRLIVLSKAAAEQLGFERNGIAPVIVETVQVGGNSHSGR